MVWDIGQPVKLEWDLDIPENTSYGTVYKFEPSRKLDRGRIRRNTGNLSIPDDIITLPDRYSVMGLSGFGACPLPWEFQAWLGGTERNLDAITILEFISRLETDYSRLGVEDKPLYARFLEIIRTAKDNPSLYRAVTEAVQIGNLEATLS